jgi:hypothetical protein
MGQVSSSEGLPTPCCESRQDDQDQKGLRQRQASNITKSPVPLKPHRKQAYRPSPIQYRGNLPTSIPKSFTAVPPEEQFEEVRLQSPKKNTLSDIQERERTERTCDLCTAERSVNHLFHFPNVAKKRRLCRVNDTSSRVDVFM